MQPTPQLEKRSFKAEVSADAPQIVGYAALYNSLSEPLTDARTGITFFERIAPGVFDATLAQSPDVRMLVNHEPTPVLGRTKSGTLKLTADARGLRIENDPPDTQFVRDLLVTMRRGDMDQMSFAFYTVRDEWTEEEVRGKKAIVRTLLAIKIDDVSVVTYPAYEATHVEARTLEKLAADRGWKPQPFLQLMAIPAEV